MRFTSDSTSTNARTRRRRAADPVHRAARKVIERLEGRQMLAVLNGGEVGYFQNAAGAYVRVTVDGDGSFAFVGATRGETNASALNDIPMTVFDTNGNLLRKNLGGAGGLDGIEPIVNVTGDTGRQSPFSGQNTSVISDATTAGAGGTVRDLDGLASMSDGTTFGVQYVESALFPTVNLVYLNANNGYVRGVTDITNQMVTAVGNAGIANFGRADIEGIIGADFNPQNERQLFFLATLTITQTGGGATPTTTTFTAPAMFIYDNVTKEVTLADRDLFGVTGGTTSTSPKIDDFTFMDDGTLAFFATSAGTNPRSGLFFSPSLTTIRLQDYQAVSIPGTGTAAATPVNAVAALEYISGQNYFVAVTSRTATADLLRIEPRGFGGGYTARVIGSAVDPDEPANSTSKRGGNVLDLAYNPVVSDNAFRIGKRGLLLGADANRHELVAFDTRDRFPRTDLYAIYGRDTTNGTSLAISTVTRNTAQNRTFERSLLDGTAQPYAGSAGGLETFMSNGDPQTLTLNNGGVLIGARINNGDDAQVVPVYSLNLADIQGDTPGGRLPSVVKPGIYIDGSMKNLLIGGTITGQVNVSGSIDTMYAGNVITGDARSGTGSTIVGGGFNTSAIGSDNFFVGGDLRNLLVSGGIGTLAGAADVFAPGTDFAIAGKVGQIRTQLEFRAALDVAGKSGAGISDEQDFTELETRAVTNTNALAIGNAFHGGYQSPYLFSLDPTAPPETRFAILNQGFANNDSFDRPQILGSFRSDDRNRAQQIKISGEVDSANNVGDGSDYYGVALLAGQTIVVQLSPPEGLTGLTTGAVLQVIDPDGNIVATDNSNQNYAAFAGKAFSVTADQPGLWRILVGPPVGYTGTFGPYVLTVDKMGEMAMGGLASGGDINLLNANLGVRIRQDDIGAILAAGDLYGANIEESTFVTGARDARFTNPITTLRGNIRSVEADNFSFLYTQPNLVGLFPNIIANGTIGLIRANAAAGRLYFNLGTQSTTGTPSPNLTTSGNIQVVETGGDAAANLLVNGAIGVIRVGSWAANDRYFRSSTLPGYIKINSDSRGADGELGLFDVTGDLGTFALGGPAIDGGSGSNVRYIRVGGSTYRDRQFGTGQTFIDTLTDQAFGITDDSGARITITPLASQTYTAPEDEEPIDPTDPTSIFGGSFSGTLPNPFGSGYIIPNPFGGTPTAPTTDINGDGVIDANDVLTDTNGDGVIDANDLPVTVVDENGNIPGVQVSGQLLVQSYPVRYGGRVVMKVQVTEGVQINTAGTGSVASGDIATVLTGSSGAKVIFTVDPTIAFGFNTNTSQAPASGGSGSNGSGNGGSGSTEQFSSGSLQSGETLEVLLTGIRTNIYELGGTAGTPDYTRVVNATDGEILNVDAGDIAYLEAQYVGVGRTVAGVKLEQRTARAANPFPLNGARNLISMANGLEIRSRGAIGNVSAGIVQNLVANSDNVNVKGVLEGITGPVVAGDLHNVDIGEGLTTTGSGEVGLGGLFASSQIGYITNRNGNGDLRGDVIVGDRVHRITIGGGGSIIDSDILQIGLGVIADTTAAGFQLGNERINIAIDAGSSVDFTSGIGDITVEGDGGGIINSQVVAFNHGIVTVGSTGFGVLGSSFVSSGGGRMGGMNVGGLGIRNVEYTGGSDTGNIIATGGGNLANLSDYSLSVRASTFSYFDPNTGASPNEATDLYRYFQTSPSEDEILGVTNEGIIADSSFAGSGSIGVIRALDFRSFNNPDGARPRDANFPMQINFGESIDAILAKKDINGLSVTTGTLGQIVARDIKSFQLQATAAVGTINAKRNVSGSTNFNIVNEGSLDQLLVGGNMNGTLFAAQGINRIVVDGDLASQYISGGIYSSSIGTVRVGGDVREGSYIRARRKLGAITVNGDLEATATLRAGTFGTVTIKGARLGTVREG